MKVQFTEVGRNKRSWVAKMRAPLSEASLYKQVKAQGQVLSSVIDFEYSAETNTGIIYAGFRRIGTFKVVEA